MTADFWQTWKELEVKHGNEDTLREMLRIKRSVQAVYNTQVNMMASAMMKETGPIGTVSDLAPTLTLGLKDDMWRLEAKGSDSDVKVRKWGEYFDEIFENWRLERKKLYIWQVKL